MNLQSRIKNKKDTEENWEKANPIILDGEVIVVESSNGELRFKTGNGITNYIDLPFMDQPLRDFSVTTEEEDLGEVEDFGIDADTLGGIAASQYITETKLNEKKYITESELNDKNYVMQDSLNNYTPISTFNSTIGNIDSILDEINGEVIS